MASNTGAALEIIQNGMTGFLLPEDIGMWADKLTDLFRRTEDDRGTAST